MSDQADEGSSGLTGRDPVPKLDTWHAHPARVYNYWLGGKDNYAVDREAAELAIAANPGIIQDVRANRAFLARAVRYLAAEAGVSQFLDIGTGLPTAGNTHEVAQSVIPAARVVYVDNDQMRPGCAHTFGKGRPHVTVTVCDCHIVSPLARACAHRAAFANCAHS
jgi:hypothetical protein